MTEPASIKPAEVRLTDETVAYLEKRIAAAVAEGIKGAMTPETAQVFWAAGVRALQVQATDRAGKFVVGGLVALARRSALFLVLGGVVYAIGGWGALASLVKTIVGK